MILKPKNKQRSYTTEKCKPIYRKKKQVSTSVFQNSYWECVAVTFEAATLQTIV